MRTFEQGVRRGRLRLRVLEDGVTNAQAFVGSLLRYPTRRFAEPALDDLPPSLPGDTPQALRVDEGIRREGGQQNAPSADRPSRPSVQVEKEGGRRACRDPTRHVGLAGCVECYRQRENAERRERPGIEGQRQDIEQRHGFFPNANWASARACSRRCASSRGCGSTISTRSPARTTRTMPKNASSPSPAMICTFPADDCRRLCPANSSFASPPVLRKLSRTPYPALAVTYVQPL